MKKPIILFLLIITLSLVGCGVNRVGAAKDITEDNFRLIPTENDHLYYDKDTFIVYYYFTDYQGTIGYSFMSPYYSENGKLVKYNKDTKKLDELN